MGNKTNPIGLRLINSKAWEDIVFVRSKDYVEFLKLSVAVRSFIDKNYKDFGLLSINIEQNQNIYFVIITVVNVEMFLFSAGQTANQIERIIQTNIWSDISLKIKQAYCFERHPAFIASKLISDVNNRSAVKSSIRQTALTALNAGALGVKACYAGRIYGVDIAQSVWHIEGRVPVHTITANIRYASIHVKTNYGICNVKVWVCLAEKDA